MKKLAGLIIILAVLIVGGYYGMGVLTERSIKENIQLVNQSNGLYADIVEYNKGLFNSSAKIKWTLNVPERQTKDQNGQSQTVPAQNVQMELPLSIHHGPIIFADNTVKFGIGYGESELQIPAQYMKDFNDTFAANSDKPKLRLTIFVDYMRKSSVGSSIPAFNLFQKSGNGKFSWLGFTADTAVSSGVETIKGNIDFDGFKMNEGDTSAQLGKISSAYNLHQDKNGLFLGNANFNILSFEATNKQKQVFKFSKLDMHSKTDVSNNLFSFETGMSLDSATADGKNYGPGQVLMIVRNLDADVLAKINQQVNSAQSGTELERQQAILGVIPLIPKLLGKGPQFEISKLSLKFPQGLVEGNMLIKIPSAEVGNPMELIPKIQGSSKLKFPVDLAKFLMNQSNIQQLGNQPELEKALLQDLQAQRAASNPAANQKAPSPEELATLQTDKQLKTMEDVGLLSKQGSDYVIEMSLEQGKLSVNGKPFDPSMLKF